MWWAFTGFWVILYFLLMFTVGLRCFRRGHWVMFTVGIFLPLFWIIGALIAPRDPQPA